MTDGGHGDHVEDLVHGGAATPDATLAAQLATVPVQGHHINQGRHDGTDARYAAQQIGLTRPARMASPAVLECPVQAFQFGLQPVQVGLLLGTHGDHLPPSHHERTQGPEVGVGQGAHGRLQYRRYPS